MNVLRLGIPERNAKANKDSKLSPVKKGTYKFLNFMKFH